MATIWFGGGESGSALEVGVNSGAGATVETGHIHTGAYAYRTNGSNTSFFDPPTYSKTSVYTNLYIYPVGNPASDNVILQVLSGTTAVMTIQMTPTGTLKIRNGSSAGTLLGTSTTALTIGAWQRIAYRVTANTGGSGVIEVKIYNISGTLVETLTFTSLTTAAATVTGAAFGPRNVTQDIYWDDIIEDDTAYPGDVKVISRSARIGTPTYDSWTKIGSDPYWGDIPSSAANKASSLNNGTTNAQTKIVGAIDSPQTGHGSEVFVSGDTLVSIQAVTVAYRGTGSAKTYKLRHRYNSVDTDVTITLNTSPAYFTHKPIDSPTLALANAFEVGGVQSGTAGGAVMSIDDFYVMVAYIPATGPTTNSITKSLKYTVKTTPASLSKSLRYAVKRTLSITKQLKYVVKTSPPITKQLKYTVKASPSLSKSLQYTLITTKSLSKSLTYAISSAQTYQITKSLQYAIKKVNQLTKQLKYTVISSPSIAKQLKYTVKTTPPSISKNLSYAVKPSFSISKSLKYTVKTTPTAISKQVKYAVKTTPSAVSKALKYLVKTIGSVSKSLQYAVRASPPISKSLKYTVKATPTAIAKSLSYKIVGTISVSKSLQYAVKTTTSSTKQLKYAVKTTPSVSKALKYAVVVSPSISKQLKYAIKTTPAISKGLQYLVRATNSLARPLKYTVKTTPSLDKTLSYAVKTSSSIQKSLSYEVYTGVTTQTIAKSLKYSVCVIDNAVYPKWIFVDGNLAMRVKGKHYTKV